MVTVNHFAFFLLIAVLASLCIEGSIGTTNTKTHCDAGYYPDGKSICRKILNSYRFPVSYDSTEEPNDRHMYDRRCDWFAGYYPDYLGICRKSPGFKTGKRETRNFLDRRPRCRTGYYPEHNGKCRRNLETGPTPPSNYPLTLHGKDELSERRVYDNRCDWYAGNYRDYQGICRKRTGFKTIKPKTKNFLDRRPRCRIGYYLDHNGRCRRNLETGPTLLSNYPLPLHDKDRRSKRRMHGRRCDWYASYYPDYLGVCRKRPGFKKGKPDTRNFLDGKPRCRIGYYLDHNGKCKKNLETGPTSLSYYPLPLHDKDELSERRMYDRRCDWYAGYYPDYLGICRKLPGFKTKKPVTSK